MQRVVILHAMVKSSEDSGSPIASKCFRRCGSEPA